MAKIVVLTAEKGGETVVISCFSNLKKAVISAEGIGLKSKYLKVYRDMKEDGFFQWGSDGLNYRFVQKELS